MAVVEDDPSMRRSVERLLNAHGFVTEGYASAEAFLHRDTKSRIGCLVLDIHLRGMSGIELRHRLKSAGSKLPVVFITAVDDKTRHSNCRAPRQIASPICTSHSRPSC